MLDLLESGKECWMVIELYLVELNSHCEIAKMGALLSWIRRHKLNLTGCYLCIACISKEVKEGQRNSKRRDGNCENKAQNSRAKTD